MIILNAISTILCLLIHLRFFNFIQLILDFPIVTTDKYCTFVRNEYEAKRTKASKVAYESPSPKATLPDLITTPMHLIWSLENS